MISEATFKAAIIQQLEHDFVNQINDAQDRLQKAEQSINPENNPDNQ